MQFRISTPAPTFSGNRLDVSLIDTGDKNRVDLDQYAVLLEETNPLNLAVQQKRGGLPPPQGVDAIAHPGVNLLADFGVHGIYRDGHMAHAQSRQLRRMLRQAKPIGRNTEKKIGKLGMDHFEGGQSGPRRWRGVSRSGAFPINAITAAQRLTASQGERHRACVGKERRC
jgi:hypothetical protein